MKKFGFPLLLACLPLCSAPAVFAHETHVHKIEQTDTQFWAQLIVVSEADAAEFDRLAEPGPDITRVETAKIGDVVAFKLIFSQMTLRPDQSADVSFDIEITQPDGALYGGGGHKNVTALSQPVLDRGRIFNSGATLFIGFEPEDPLGVYEIKMTVLDKVGGHQVSLEETINLVK